MRAPIQLAVAMLSILFQTAPLFAASKFLDVPYSRQFQAFTCGHESLRMVLAYWGKRESREKILLAIGANGTTVPVLRQVVKKKFKEFQADVVPANLDAIKKQLDLGRPVLTATWADKLSYLDYESSGGHMVIAVGYDDEKKIMYIRDSNSAYVEQIPYDDFSKAIMDSPQSTVVIYKADTPAPTGPARDFDKAYKLGQKRDDSGRIPLSVFIPAFFLSYETEPRQNLGDSFAASSKRSNRQFTLSWNGVSYGKQTMEQTPWLGNGKVHDTIGFGAAWTVGTNLRLAPTELLSPGIYSFGRHRALDIHDDSGIKRIPRLTIPRNTFELTGYLKKIDETSLQYDSLGVDAVAWSGGRFGWRRGIDPFFGHFAAGVSAGKVDLKLDGSDAIISTGTTNYDVSLGILKGAIQTVDLDPVVEIDREGLSIRAYSVGVDYDFSFMHGGIFTPLNRLGMLHPHIELTNETIRRHDNDIDRSINNRRWDVELAVPLHYVDMTYGGSLNQSTDINGVRDSFRSAWFRLAFNAYLPLVQLTAGYRVFYKDFDETIGQQISLGMFFGM